MAFISLFSSFYILLPHRNGRRGTPSLLFLSQGMQHCLFCSVLFLSVSYESVTVCRRNRDACMRGLERPRRRSTCSVACQSFGHPTISIFPGGSLSSRACVECSICSLELGMSCTTTTAARRTGVVVHFLSLSLTVA